MTSMLERSDTLVARVRVAPSGDVELVSGEECDSAYGPVEVTWYRDRLSIAALGAGPASITAAYASGEAEQDLVVEIRLPRLDELTETVPGAD